MKRARVRNEKGCFWRGGGCRKRGRGERSKKRLVKFLGTDMKDENRGRVERKSMHETRSGGYQICDAGYRVQGTRYESPSHAHPHLRRIRYAYRQRQHTAYSTAKKSHILFPTSTENATISISAKHIPDPNTNKSSLAHDTANQDRGGHL